MVKQSILEQTMLISPLAGQSQVNPKGGVWKRVIVADLLLTALIDAFSILVIFLLISFSSTGELLYMGKGMELPKAALAAQLELNPVIKLENGKIFVEEKEVAPAQLVEHLLGLRKEFQASHPGEEFPGIVTLQADRRLKYEDLTQIVQATSHAGYSDIKFAVIMK